MEWQPIETAPKDGTAIDLWAAQGFRLTSCAWDFVEFSCADGSGSDVQGWTNTEGHGSVEGAGPFTHWMPLPAPPAARVQP